jgi:hypothetical protein
MKKDKTAFPASQVKLQKYNKYCRRKGLPNPLKGVASGSRPDKYCPAIRNTDQFRRQPSLAPCRWLSRPDPDEVRRVVVVDQGDRVVGVYPSDQAARQAMRGPW